MKINSRSNVWLFAAAFAALASISVGHAQQAPITRSSVSLLPPAIIGARPGVEVSIEMLGYARS